jgi:phage baseplate assembly protein W
MFLERKFMSPDECRPAADASAWRGLPERVLDVVRSVERLLATERGVGHVLHDYGLSRSGQWSVEGILAHTTAELRETLCRYEARFVFDEDDLETDLDDDGHPMVLVVGRVDEVRVTLVIDPLRRRVHDVQLG